MGSIHKMAEEEFDKIRKYYDTLTPSWTVQEGRLKLVEAMAQFCSCEKSQTSIEE